MRFIQLRGRFLVELNEVIVLLQLFASVAPILLVETGVEGNEEESELDDLAGKVWIFYSVNTNFC